MKTLDWLIQTLLLAVSLIVLVISLYKNQDATLLIYIQSVMASWQILSALWFLRFSSNSKHRRIFLYVAFAYLLLLIGFALATIKLPVEFIIGGKLIVPWLVMIGYYIITWKITFSKHTKRGKFLPHINF